MNFKKFIALNAMAFNRNNKLTIHKSFKILQNGAIDFWANANKIYASDHIGKTLGILS